MNGNVKQLINTVVSSSRMHIAPIAHRDTINFNKKDEILDIKSISGDKGLCAPHFERLSVTPAIFYTYLNL
jgi:hypothetical protein